MSNVYELASVRNRKRNHKRKKGSLPPFVPLIRTTLASPAWKQLSFGARSLYVVLRSYLRVDNLNNGKIYRSYREAADDLGTKSRTSVQRWFRELEHYGFIVMTTGASLGVDGEGVAAHWRITECPTFDSKGTHIAPTRNFDRWDGVLFDDPEKTKSCTQKRDTPSLKEGHTDDAKPGRRRLKCPQKRDIDSDASMSLKEGHNCLPLPLSPTAIIKRDTRPYLTESVLQIVHAQLDELEVISPEVLREHLRNLPPGWCAWSRDGLLTPTALAVEMGARLPLAFYVRS